MKRKLLILLFGVLGYVGYTQDCPSPISPLDGDTNVGIDASISWQAVAGVSGYEIRLGTTDGGSEIAEVTVGNATTYNPPLGLPADTIIYVTIVLRFFGQGGSSDDVICDSYSFRTESITTLPSCTQIVNPADGATDVSVFTNISWEYAFSATGYRITMGTTPGGFDILNGFDVGNT